MPADRCCILASESALHLTDTVCLAIGTPRDDLIRRQSAEVVELTGGRCSRVRTWRREHPPLCCQRTDVPRRHRQ